VRGKVTSFVLNDSVVSDDKKIEARDTAQRYFTLAYSYILN
jgi:aminoglycoside phosphotransferase family enzyme